VTCSCVRSAGVYTQWPKSCRFSQVPKFRELVTLIALQKKGAERETLPAPRRRQCFSLCALLFCVRVYDMREREKKNTKSMLVTRFCVNSAGVIRSGPVVPIFQLPQIGELFQSLWHKKKEKTIDPKVAGQHVPYEVQPRHDSEHRIPYVDQCRVVQVHIYVGDVCRPVVPIPQLPQLGELFALIALQTKKNKKNGWPLHDIVITNIVRCMANKRGAGGVVSRTLVVQQYCNSVGNIVGGAIHEWLTRAQQLQSKRISCKGQRVYMLVMCFCVRSA